MRRLFSSAAIGVLLLPATWFVLVGQAPPLPGTSADRIGFPADYKSTFKQLYVLDNNQNQQVRVIWANDIAQTVDPAQPWNFPDGSFATAPAASGGCALCHLQGSSAALANNLPPMNAKNDYVFRVENYFNGGSGATPDGVMLNYVFVPKTVHVQAGTPLTLYNGDQILHTIVAD